MAKENVVAASPKKGSWSGLKDWFGNIVSPKSVAPASMPIGVLEVVTKPTLAATMPKTPSLPIAIKGANTSKVIEAPAPVSASLVPLKRVEGGALESEIKKRKQVVEQWRQEALTKNVPPQNATGQRYEEEMGLFNLEIEIPLGDAPSRPDTPEQEREQADTSRSATPANESGSEEEEKSLDFTGNQGKISMASSLPPVKFIGHINDDSFEVGRPGERSQERTRMWASKNTNPFLEALGKYEKNGVGSTTPKPEKRDKLWQDNLKISREQGGFSQQGL